MKIQPAYLISSFNLISSLKKITLIHCLSLSISTTNSTKQSHPQEELWIFTKEYQHLFYLKEEKSSNNFLRKNFQSFDRILRNNLTTVLVRYATSKTYLIE